MPGVQFGYVERRFENALEGDEGALCLDLHNGGFGEQVFARSVTFVGCGLLSVTKATLLQSNSCLINRP